MIAASVRAGKDYYRQTEESGPLNEIGKIRESVEQVDDCLHQAALER